MFWIVDIVSWFLVLCFGFVDIIMYFVDSLWSGMCVVFLIVLLLLLWLMINILLEVLIKIDLIFFLKLWRFNFGGRMMCWLDGILIFLLICVFNVVFRWEEVEMFNCMLFFDVM